MKCDRCSKEALTGHNVSHSKHRTNRRFKPNVHPATVMIDGKPTRMNLCTRCLRTINKVENVKETA